MPNKPALFINRELSWLEFNARVLAEALDERVPLLERLKFISIFGTNLDEFYMVRVAGLRRQLAGRVASVTAEDAVTLKQQIEQIEARVREMLGQLRSCLYGDLLPAIAARGVRLVSMADLAPEERRGLDGFFESQVYPVLTPLAVDPEHPFPYISNLSLSLAVELRDPERGVDRFARVKVPKSLPRWVPVPGRRNTFVPLEEIIGGQLGALFAGMQVVGWHTFRITRYSDLEISDTEESEDLLAMIEERVFQRRFGEVVRVEVQHGMPVTVRKLLIEELRETDDDSLTLSHSEIHELGSLLDLGDLMALALLDLPELRDPPFTPKVPVELRQADRTIFDLVRERDLLVHCPFDSFAASVEHFIEAASRDEQVMAIKMTLYRTSGDGAIIRALTEAARRGIQVAVLVELQARFEEVNNITWARTLESFGVHVAYGLPGLKTHAKVALVVRREPEGIRRYVHLGTGNYNSKTARIYTDIGLFTCAEAICADASDLFNTLTGFSRQRVYRRLIVAPAGMRERVVELIEREAQHARAGRPARIVAKMNALVDKETIDALYAASQAGVTIDLIIRGICCLRPGVPGASDNIRVISIVGRFLEHSRIWHFGNDATPEYYITSADWMPRNFSYRVEVAVPIDDPVLQARLAALLETCLADDRQAWVLSEDGGYARRCPNDGNERATHTLLQRDSWGLMQGPQVSKVKTKRMADVVG